MGKLRLSEFLEFVQGYIANVGLDTDLSDSKASVFASAIFWKSCEIHFILDFFIKMNNTDNNIILSPVFDPH